ncbi:GntR family transcriptional regulator [Corynebacterium uropygiale]|uniref:GntR family transcriptional regulator n=1 Tax=Corynebacterium uropygiale TaxID=1775911 RepID=A0A9X1QSM4_9CORY|nr:GntR family transcriptional regulator [Corynebacterium uropygiale]
MHRDDHNVVNEYGLSTEPPGFGQHPKAAYVTIADAIRSDIRAHRVKPGQRLPAERDLVEQYQVARMTVRHALDLLQLEGLIDRRRGRHGGTFVRAEPPSVNLLRLGENAEVLRRQGYNVRITPWVNRIEAPTVEIADTLGDPEYVHYVCQELVFNDMSAAVLRTHCRVDHEPTLSEDAVEESIGRLLEDSTSSTEDTISIGAATDTERDLLGVPPNLPLLRVTRLGYDSAGQCVYCMSIALRSEILTLEVKNDKNRGGGG